jgi:hypothetical protein
MRNTVLIAVLGAVLACTAAASPNQAQALGRWLPRLTASFTPWGQSKAAYGAPPDAFVCGGTNASPAPIKASGFEYPEATCPVLKTGTAFSFGSGEPQQSHVVYDPTHRIALFSTGCCAARSYALASGVPAPPGTVVQADLSGVRTNRGAALGMTLDEITRRYGKAVSFTVAGPGGSTVPVLTYTTFTSDPVHASQACGQYQTFAFRSNKVYLIELYVGC